MAKRGLQVSLISNITHPGILVLGEGTVIPPRTHTALEVSLAKVRVEHGGARFENLNSNTQVCFLTPPYLCEEVNTEKYLAITQENTQKYCLPSPRAKFCRITHEKDNNKTDRSGLKHPILDWTEKPCVRADSLDFKRDLKAFLFTSVNCDFAARREVLHSFCGNCTMYYNAGHIDSTTFDNCTLDEIWNCYEIFNQHYYSTSENSSDYRNNGSVMFRQYNDLLKQCVWVCEQSDFQNTAITTRVSPQLEGKINEQLGLPKDEKLSFVTIQYPWLHYRLNTLTRMSFPELIGMLGGSMGSLAGSSLVTLLEFVVFALLGLYALWGKLRSLGQ
ncbi:uncharacterized protein LOC122259242 [Penaeus japonicus]|uniref:uncharacterized protein LOC122259242 n=1 Tax=Penaeus japonicus TaxID=27405 RepID=UPI001C70C24F|nr:uncharacterized protein LOC122259242 [Penaeus japonicus]